MLSSLYASERRIPILTTNHVAMFDEGQMMKNRLAVTSRSEMRVCFIVG